MNAPATIQRELSLEQAPLGDRTPINGCVYFVDRDGYRVVFRWEMPIYRIALADAVHLREVAVNLRQSELATQEQIAHAFGHTVITQSRWEHAFQKDGIEGLLPKRPSGRRPTLDKSQDVLLRKWFHQELSNCEMAKRLSVDEATIRRTLKRLKLTRKVRLTPMLAGIENQTPEVPAAGNGVSLTEAGTDVSVSLVEDVAETPVTMTPVGEVSPGSSPEPCVACETFAEPEAKYMPSFTMDNDPNDRSGDRLLARLGRLEDAVPLFDDHASLPHAGVLLAAPLLVRHGLIDAFAKVYGSCLAPSFYGLRTMAVVLFLAALLRIKRTEHLKEHRPGDLGAIVGLDRMPEVKTVRRKFTDLAAMERAKQLMDELAHQRIARDKGRVAFLYADGHVREYHGKSPLFSAKKPQRQVATPTVTDTWVHDARGEPLLVVTSEVNAHLTQILEIVLADVRRVIGDQRRITLIFDRGGFSPKLFARLIAQGCDIITYRKGRTGKMPKHCFATEREKIDGLAREYELCDRPRVRVGALPAAGKRKKGRKGKAGKRYLWMREVRVLREDERQTSILTNRQDLSAVMVAYRIFNRWRQENYFKYMAEEFALDALVEYGTKELPESTDRPNPQWLRVTRRLKEARAEVSGLRCELGKEAAYNNEAARPTMRGFKIAHAELRKQLEEAETRVTRLLEQRCKIPKRILATDRVALKSEKKLVADAIKMAAYQVETELLGLLQDHYARSGEEGRTLLHAAFQSPAQLEVTEGELRVTIASQSSPHRTAALAALCEQLDAFAIPFPGTNLRLRLAVQTDQPIISE
jgi:prepilin-type processing-associated H-X9-DG protein